MIEGLVPVLSYQCDAALDIGYEDLSVGIRLGFFKNFF